MFRTSRRLAALCLATVTGIALAVPGAAAADLPSPTGTAPVTGAATAPPAGPHPPTLVGVRTGRHAGYDRTVFDFTGGTPGYRVEYGALSGIGTGSPIPLAGAADLRVTFDGAYPYDAVTGAATIDLRRTYDPALPTLRQIRFGGAFEGMITAGLGLADRVGFRVVRLTGPPRLAVDVAHQPSQAFGTAAVWAGGDADRVRIAEVRTGTHPGYDRVVLELATAGHPLTSVSYRVPQPSVIHVGLTGLTTGAATIAGPNPIAVNLPRVRRIALTAYPNGTASVFVATTRRTGFRVLMLEQPTRIVVDVAH